jgi:hypothetical protein
LNIPSTAALIVGPLIVPSAEQPSKKPIHTQIITINTNLIDNKLIKLLIVKILIPPEFNCNDFIFPPLMIEINGTY